MIQKEDSIKVDVAEALMDLKKVAPLKPAKDITEPTFTIN